MQKNTKWKNELEKIANIIRKVPELDATIKWGAEVFTYNGKNVVSYGGFKDFFSLWFYNGVFLKDPYKVLITASGGKTKSQRQWRFASLKDIEEKKILAYIKEAIEIEKKGLKIAPEKFKPIPIPAILKQVLDKKKTFKTAFEKLTPGKQKEYCLYINEAKQEATKIKRVEKITPMILSGQGLYDKYK